MPVAGRYGGQKQIGAVSSVYQVPKKIIIVGQQYGNAAVRTYQYQLCLLLTQARLWSRVHGFVHGSSGQKAIRKFNIVGVRKKKKAGSDEEKAGGASESSPGGRFPRSPLAEVGHRRPFFRRHVVVLLCGWDVAAPRGRLRPSGARESPLFWGGCFNQDISKIQKNVTTTLAYYIIRISINQQRSVTMMSWCMINNKLGKGHGNDEV